MEQARAQHNDEVDLEAVLWGTQRPEGVIGTNGVHTPESVQSNLGLSRDRRAAAEQDAGPGNPLRRLPLAGELERGMPQSAMKIAEFVKNFFVPEHVAMKASSGRAHYQALLKHVLTPEEVDRSFQIDAENSRTKLKLSLGWPYLGNLRLCDTRPEDVQRLIAAASARGYSAQTVTHIRNVVRAIFEHAKRRDCFHGDNPAIVVNLPEMIHKDAHALTLAQAEEVLAAMRYPEKELALTMLLTGMNVAEICGLQWKYVNLSNEWSNTESEFIPPGTIVVRKQWYRGELDKLAKKSRTRSLRIPAALLPVFVAFCRRPHYVGPDDFVFVTPAGRPVGAKQIAAYRLKKIGKKVRMPWLSWHAFHRTHTALAYQFGMDFLERRALMRHSAPQVSSALVRPELAAFSFATACQAHDIEGEDQSAPSGLLLAG